MNNCAVSVCLISKSRYDEVSNHCPMKCILDGFKRLHFLDPVKITYGDYPGFADGDKSNKIVVRLALTSSKIKTI